MDYENNPIANCEYNLDYTIFNFPNGHKAYASRILLQNSQACSQSDEA